MQLSELFHFKKADISGKKGIVFDLDGTLADSMSIWYSAKLWAGKSESYRQNGMRAYYETTIEPKPYVIDMLTELKNCNIPVCILSATPTDVSAPFIARYGIADLVSFYMDCEEWGGSKSTPEPYYTAIEKLGLTRDEAIVFEDFPSSAMTAVRGGLCVIGVYDETSKDSLFELRHYCSDYIYNFGQVFKKPK